MEMRTARRRRCYALAAARLRKAEEEITDAMPAWIRWRWAQEGVKDNFKIKSKAISC
jgi:hypothetical protein